MGDELSAKGIKLKPEDKDTYALLYDFRKKLALMRTSSSLESILPLRTMATLAYLDKPISSSELTAILERDQVLTNFTEKQQKAFLTIINEGFKSYQRMTSLCHRCGTMGHPTVICTRRKDEKAVNEAIRKRDMQKIVVTVPNVQDREEAKLFQLETEMKTAKLVRIEAERLSKLESKALEEAEKLSKMKAEMIRLARLEAERVAKKSNKGKRVLVADVDQITREKMARVNAISVRLNKYLKKS